MRVRFRSHNWTAGDRTVVKDRRRINPLLLFVGTYLVYNLVGLLNTPWTVAGAYDKALGWELFLNGLGGFCLGFLLFGRQKRKIDPRRRTRRRTSKQLTALFFLLFLVCLTLVVVLSGGIPLFMGEDRFGNSALAFNLAQLYGFWVLVRLISDLEEGRRFLKLQPIIYMCGALCFGYRTPILIFCFVVIVYLVVFRLSRLRAIMLGGLAAAAFIGFAAAFAGYRVSQDYDVESFFSNIDFQFIAEHEYLFPFVPALSMFDYSQNTISSIGNALRDRMFGQLFLSNYETFLPGKHWGARNIIGDITAARWVAGRPMSITPTLQGALYVDFGYVGVFFGLFAIAVGIGWMWRCSGRWGALGKFSFCYLMTLSVMSIHNGYWDVGFVFFLLFLLIVRVFDYFRASMLPLAARRAI